MAITNNASFTINEMREFAAFTAREQRYIRRSIDIGLGREDAFRRWARDADEIASIRSQYVAYQDLKTLRSAIPDPSDSAAIEAFMGKLVRMAAFDLMQDRIACFSAFRFLYERLLGAQVRPWLPAAFCGAAALPQVRPDRRKTLLHSISEAAATAPGWSEREPTFLPEWIDTEAA